MRLKNLCVKSLDIERSLVEYFDVEIFGGGTMYDPFAIDRQRIQREALRRRTAAAPHRVRHETATHGEESRRRWHFHLVRRPRPATDGPC
jgi:hypothetical protein